jgi:glycosyltransferase involved in cell wall biosynthesis
VVGTNVDAIGEILEDGITGLVVNPADATELATALQQLIAQPQLRQQFGTAAREKVLRELAPAVEQQNWRQIYQNVMGSAPCPKVLAAV